MSKPLFCFLVFLAAGLFFWRSGEAFLELWSFFRLDTQVVAKIKNWQVDQVSSSKFTLIASYEYVFQNKKLSSESRVAPPYFLNSYAARDALSLQSYKEHKIWIDSTNPTYTAMAKKFPYLSVFYSLISLVVLLYFFYVKERYIPRSKSL